MCGALNRSRTSIALTNTAHVIFRYGLVAILLLFGAEKWTPEEASGIEPWMSHSPVLFWLYKVTSVQGASIVVGVVELTIAALIASRRWVPMASAVGSLIAIAMFMTTISFLFTSPGMDPASQGFLLKDVFLLGAACWSAGEALHGNTEARHL